MFDVFVLENVFFIFFFKKRFKFFFFDVFFGYVLMSFMNCLYIDILGFGILI